MHAEFALEKNQLVIKVKTFRWFTEI